MNITNMMNESLKYLSLRNRSEKTVRTFLEEEFGNSKKIHNSINDVLEQLKAESLIDDSRFASTLASYYTHKGNRFIAELLKGKGISDSIISETLLKLDSEVNRALKEVKNRFDGQWYGTEVINSFIYRFLNGRKFSHLTARLVAEDLALFR
ncbi:MAG: RecX family transcriptional regulator [Tatlockia sp.]|nr:RecX family transcriptional regulator [Tatlockia sp.]